MTMQLRTFFALAALCLIFTTRIAGAAQSSEQFNPTEGQEGKDVVWVPTPAILVEHMLDVAKVTPQDFVMDLGSGDGRNIIAAAKRGARALGVEYNPNMVALAQNAAADAGVADKAQFVQGDMYEADISQATVLALFLLPENLRKLTPKFADLKPGTRIVANTFGISDWEVEQTTRTEGDCYAWCTALLYLVPAKVAGQWRMPQGVLTIEQKYQTFTGTLLAAGVNTSVANGRLNGDRISFNVGGIEYTGRVSGDSISSVAGNPAWSATRVNQR
jgi:SAM-dependent methyltransferase